jgi:hypothetical protein
LARYAVAVESPEQEPPSLDPELYGQLFVRSRIKRRHRALTTLLLAKGAFGLVLLFLALVTITALARVRPEALSADEIANLHGMRARLWGMVASLPVEVTGVGGALMGKRWGLYVLGGASLVSIALRFAHGETLLALVGLVVTGTVVALIFPRWHEYE